MASPARPPLSPVYREETLMNVIIVGIGFMGTGLAQRLIHQGFAVTAVDQNQAALDALGTDFPGRRVCGVGFDRTVLERAGIERTDAVVSCMGSDEANIVVAHVARSTFRVPRVIARLYDISKAEAYRRLGIQTISTTDWGIRHACELITYQEMDTVLEIGSGDVQLVRSDVPALLEGRPVREVTAIGEVLYNHLLDALLNDPAEEADKKHIEMLRQACANYIVVMAARRMMMETGSLTDRGLYFSTIEAGEKGNEKIQPLGTDRIAIQIQNLKADADMYMGALQRVVNLYFPQFNAGNPQRVFDRDNDHKKTFWA